MVQENYDSTASESSDYSSYSLEQSLENQIELKEGNSYTSHEAFVIAVKNYAKQQGFQVRLGKYEKNAAGQIRKRTIVCSREGTSGSSLKIRNRSSQRCNCKFLVRASCNSDNNLWYIILTQLKHNHSMILADHQRFTSEERLIPLEVQQKIMLLRRAGCNILTIRAILKEEFDGIITWIICFAGTLMLNESADSFSWVFSTFLKMVNNYAPKVFFTDEDSAIIKANDQIFQPFGTKHVLCLWHLLKNVMKNLSSILESDWAMFIKSFYKCLDEYEEKNFIEKWEQLKAHYPKAVKYLSKMDKNLKRWAPCYNRQMFMADITTTQRGESMNNLMKGYMDAMTSLTTFLKAFESALEQRKEATEFIKYQEKNEIIKLVTSSPYEKQASELLTKYALKKTQHQLLEFMTYKCETIYNNGIEITFQVERFQSQAHSRIVKYNLTNHQFFCSCYSTVFSGIICRHIFKVASQLNLEELPQYLFFLRWRKDPDEQVLIKTYRTFYNTSITSQQINSINIEEDNNDYEYLLKRTWRKVQDIINTKPEMAKSFYISFDKILQEEIKAHVSGKNPISLAKDQIKNPPTIKSKGRTSNKRTLSRFETTKSSNSSKKRILEPNLQNTNEILEVDDIEENNIDFKSDNFQSSFKNCSIKENIQTR
ncbi:40497_t:CDS:2, partial [Gigaspora margarita]